MEHHFGIFAVDRGVRTYCSCGWIAPSPTYGNALATTIAYAWRQHAQVDLMGRPLGEKQ